MIFGWIGFMSCFACSLFSRGAVRVLLRPEHPCATFIADSRPRICENVGSIVAKISSLSAAKQNHIAAACCVTDEKKLWHATQTLAQRVACRAWHTPKLGARENHVIFRISVQILKSHRCTSRPRERVFLSWRGRPYGTSPQYIFRNPAGIHMVASWMLMGKACLGCLCDMMCLKMLVYAK